MDKVITISEDQIINQFQEFLTDCDADELARIAGEVFGGKCYFFCRDDGKSAYEFYPDENYMGAFGELSEN